MQSTDTAPAVPNATATDDREAELRRAWRALDPTGKAILFAITRLLTGQADATDRELLESTAADPETPAYVAVFVRAHLQSERSAAA